MASGTSQGFEPGAGFYLCRSITLRTSTLRDINDLRLPGGRSGSSNAPPPKTHAHPVPRNATLFGNLVFAGVISSGSQDEVIAGGLCFVLVSTTGVLAGPALVVLVVIVRCPSAMNFRATPQKGVEAHAWAGCSAFIGVEDRGLGFCGLTLYQATVKPKRRLPNGHGLLLKSTKISKQRKLSGVQRPGSLSSHVAGNVFIQDSQWVIL